MNLLKKFFGLAILLFFVVNVSQAQQIRTAPSGAKGHGGGLMGGDMETLIEELDLSSQQVQELKSLRADLKEDMKEARSSGDREEMRDLRQAFREELSEILTPAQMTQLEALRAERRAEKGKAPRGKGNKANKSPEDRINHRVAKMTEQLNLSNGQASEIKGIMLENLPQMEALKAAGDQDGMKKLRKAQNKAIKSVLTPEQKKALSELKAEHKENRGKGKGKGRMDRD